MMHGHLCPHDLIVFLTVTWEGLLCCLMFGHVMFFTALRRLKSEVRLEHVDS